MIYFKSFCVDTIPHTKRFAVHLGPDPECLPATDPGNEANPTAVLTVNLSVKFNVIKFSKKHKTPAVQLQPRDGVVAREADFFLRSAATITTDSGWIRSSAIILSHFPWSGELVSMLTS